MTEIQQNRWDQLVRRAANIVAPGSMVSDSLNELFPMLNVETLNAELLLLTGWRLVVAGSNEPSSTGDVNHHQLFNPAGSGHIITVTSVQFRAAAIMEIRYGTTTADLAGVTGNPSVRDTRVGPGSSVVGIVSSLNQVAGAPQNGNYLVQANVTAELKDENGLFVLGPGTGVNFTTTVTGTASIVNFFWKERVAQAAELNF